jgi:uncharacterized protein (TIGR03118 family)
MQRRMIPLTFALGFALMFVSSAAVAQYQLKNLDSIQVGQSNHKADPLLVNAWGLARSATSPFWLSDEGSGWSTLYNGAGAKQGLQVVVPSAGGNGPGSPTGIVFNGSQDFQVHGKNAFFLFATLDGTVSAWAPEVNLNEAKIMVDNSSSGASYTGLAITSNASGNFLFAADTVNNKIDMYDGSFHLKNSFTDTTVAAGFAPFGIQDIDGLVFVAFAAQSGGPGGYIDVFSEKGEFLKRLAQGSPLNQPWGLAAAPKAFGPLSNTLLVSNNVNFNGTINGFNALTGQFVGTVRDAGGAPIKIDQLWGIEFGGGTPSNGGKNQLFFTAGPSNNLAGTFGVITVVP